MSAEEAKYKVAKFVGAHVSTAGGVSNAPINAKTIGARAFAFFTKNQRRWFDHIYEPEEINDFKENLKNYGFNSKHIVAHASYLINLGSPEAKKLALSTKSLIDECRRCMLLGVGSVVVHPGSHLERISEDESMNRIASSIDQTIETTDTVNILLENTAGQGSNLGYKLEQLVYILDKVQNKNRVGVCLDTCHLFASGYDFRTVEQYEGFFVKFDRMIGMSFLKALHLNDSRGDLGSLIDRHESLGRGKIGLDAFKLIMQDSRLNDIPLILETIDSSLWKQEITMLQNFSDAQN